MANTYFRSSYPYNLNMQAIMGIIEDDQVEDSYLVYITKQFQIINTEVVPDNSNAAAYRVLNWNIPKLIPYCCYIYIYINISQFLLESTKGLQNMVHLIKYTF